MANHVEPDANARDLFGGEVTPQVRELVEAARMVPRGEAPDLLQRALSIEPASLPVHYLLYKLYASLGELERAEAVARAAIQFAGREAGLPEVPTAAAEAVPLGASDFQEPGAARFWLFSLKALAFICTRKGDLEQSRLCMRLIQRYDPQHSVGSEVTQTLVDAASGA